MMVVSGSMTDGLMPERGRELALGGDTPSWNCVKSTGAASSDSRRGKHDGGEEDVESSSDGSYSLVAAASER